MTLSSCDVAAIFSPADLVHPEPSLRVPARMAECPGIPVGDRIVRSFLFSTDVAVICHCDADAVLAVYPFTGHPKIMRALLAAAPCPVFTGVGGSATPPARSLELAKAAKAIGMAGVVVNSLVDISAVRAISAEVDIPLVLTIYELRDVMREKIEAGAGIVNVAAGKMTPQVVSQVREAYPPLRIMASGGHTDATIAATVASGADAVSWTPPNIQDIEHDLMNRTRSHAS